MRTLKTPAKTFVSILMSMALVCLPVLVQPARADIIVNTTFPISFVIFSSCTGPIAVTATEHFLVRTEGADKLGLHINIEGTGTQLITGAKYEISEEENEQVTNPPGPPFSFNLEISVHLIGQGSAPNLLVHVVETFSFPPPTLTVKSMFVKCQ